MSWATPGPWEVAHRTVTAPETDEALAMRVLITDCGNPKVNKANARLIAAAPDLLAALQDCLAWFENDCPLDATCGPEMRNARAAIARATGSPP